MDFNPKASELIRPVGSGGIHAAWGRSGLDNEQAALRLLEENRCVKIVGHEQPLAILTEDREVKPFNAAQPVRKGIKDMSIMGLGPVYALDGRCISRESSLKPERGIIRYQSFQDFVNDTAGTTVTHPAFDFTHPVSLYATESRLLVLFGGPLSHVFEVTEDPKGEITVLLVEDLEGVGVTSVVPGSANRFTLLTEAGDAYLISKGTIEPELLEIDDESPVRLMGLGSKFEVLVTEQSVWVRGDSEWITKGDISMFPP